MIRILNRTIKCDYQQAVEHIKENNYGKDIGYDPLHPYTLWWSFVCGDDEDKAHLLYFFAPEILSVWRIVKGDIQPKNAEVFEMRYGLHERGALYKLGVTMTLREIGIKYNVQQERIRQRVAKTLRQLKHPSRMALIERHFYNDGLNTLMGKIKPTEREAQYLKQIKELQSY